MFVVPPLGGIEPERSGEIPVKTGTTNGENPLVKHMPNKFTASPRRRIFLSPRRGELLYPVPMDIEWNFFDRNAESLVTKRNMPHVDMPGHLTFVTFRLVDSMPREVVKQWHDEIELWLKERNLTGRTIEDVLRANDIKESIKNELRHFKNRKWHGHLDDCYGDCELRAPQSRELVEGSLLHFHGQRYDLERFVIMPNHVHLLIQMRPGFPLRKQLTETMRYTGRHVNAFLAQQGTFWQSEPFDHVVRSGEQFEYLQQYISENPQKAQLSKGEYTLWIRPR